MGWRATATWHANISMILMIARKLLFTVGAHEGLKSGSETGKKGVAGERRAGDVDFAALSRWAGLILRRNGRVMGGMV